MTIKSTLCAAAGVALAATCGYHWATPLQLLHKANFYRLADSCTHISNADDLMGYDVYGHMEINSSTPAASYSYYTEKFGPCIKAYTSYMGIDGLEYNPSPKYAPVKLSLNGVFHKFARWTSPEIDESSEDYLNLIARATDIVRNWKKDANVTGSFLLSTSFLFDEMEYMHSDQTHRTVLTIPAHEMPISINSKWKTNENQIVEILSEGNSSNTIIAKDLSTGIVKEYSTKDLISPFCFMQIASSVVPGLTYSKEMTGVLTLDQELLTKLSVTVPFNESLLLNVKEAIHSPPSYSPHLYTEDDCTLSDSARTLVFFKYE